MLPKLTLLAIILLLILAVIKEGIPPSFILGIFSECTGHKARNFHTHSTLQIIQDGKQIPVPANIGFRTGCIHPLHTHDSTGLIHMDYPLKVRFTLGNFFDRMGVILSDRGMGSIADIDGYNFKVFVNGRELKNGYRNIVLRDRDKIQIIIASP